jgi:branched-chain amino acid aminotransferase
VFPGITRRSVLEIAERIGVEAVERRVDPDELRRCEGAFLASTMLELRPLSAIDRMAFATAEHPLYRRIRAEFEAATHA